MRVPLSWIRDFTPADAPVDELVAALNQLGLEVEAVEEPGREVLGVRVARILEVIPHPDADRLRLADVDFGDGTTRVVCGAPNIEAGQLVPLAPSGATLPGGFVLERRTIRGQVSDGMLCSAKELGLGDDHGGILVLDPGAVPGDDVRPALALDDVVFDLAITPNRPDAMCVVGVAREIAAHLGEPFALPTSEPSLAKGVGADVTVVVEAPDRCPRYLARVARVTMGPSPAWMQQRLLKAGMRPINNVVDVTNYVLLERNQPLHAFDLGRLAGRGIVVRTAESGEHLTTLDGVKRLLDADDLLICDAERSPQAIAGVMGGATSEVAPDTTEILLESAYFERMGIARTSKRLKLRSEASARFERGLDPDGVAVHAARALELLVDVAEAQVAGDMVDVVAQPFVRPSIAVRTSKVNAVLGTSLDDRAVAGALTPLGIEVSGTGDALLAVPPSFRPDLEREIDLVEEVARRVGFDAIGRTVPKPEHQVGALTPRQRKLRAAADALVGAGVSEAMTVPLVAPALLARFGVTDAVELANPLRAEESALRTALLPGLLEAAGFNAARGQASVALFEMGAVFGRPAADELLPDERDHIAVVLTGLVDRRPIETVRAVDGYDATDLLGVLSMGLGAGALGAGGLGAGGLGAGGLGAGALGTGAFETGRLALADVRATRAPAGWHPRRSMRIVADAPDGPIDVGIVGELAPDVVGAAGLTGTVAAFEVDLTTILATFPGASADHAFVAPSPFPLSAIDLAFVVSDEVLAGAVAATIRGALGPVVESVRAFDEFRSDDLGDGQRSLAFAVRLRAPDRTLTDAEVAALRAEVVAEVARAHEGRLRG